MLMWKDQLSLAFVSSIKKELDPLKKKKKKKKKELEVWKFQKKKEELENCTQALKWPRAAAGAPTC